MYVVIEVMYTFFHDGSMKTIQVPSVGVKREDAVNNMIANQNFLALQLKTPVGVTIIREYTKGKEELNMPAPWDKWPDNLY